MIRTSLAVPVPRYLTWPIAAYLCRFFLSLMAALDFYARFCAPLMQAICCLLGSRLRLAA